MTQDIKDGVLAVEMAKASRFYKTPNGIYPVCIPGVGTCICERCNNPIALTKGNACPGVPRSERWDVKDEEIEEGDSD